MKILHISPSYIPAYRYGGPIYSVHGLCQALAKLGHDVQVYTTNVNGDQDSAVPIGEAVDVEGVKVWYFPSQFLRRLYYSPQLEQHLKTTIQQFDIIHLHSVFLWPTLVGARYAEKYHVPYVLSPRGMLIKDLIEKKSAWIKKIWINLFEIRTIAKASLLHLTADLELTALQDFNFQLPRCAVIANGVDLPENQAIKATADPFGCPLGANTMLLFLSRINWKKGLDRLIPAMQYMQKDVYLRIVGNDEEGYLPELKKLVAHLQLADRVFFHPAVYDQKLKAALYQAAAVFILPSYSENFGNVVLEALSYGCPVVVTPEVGLSAFIKENKLGLVSAGEPKSLANSIQMLLADQVTRMDIQKRSQQIVFEHFSWQSIAEKMLTHYKNILL